MPKDEGVIILNSNGSADFLYDDDHPGLNLGEMVEVARVSDIGWDDTAGGWVINYWPPFHVLRDGRAFTRRADAIREEIRAINAYVSEA